MKAFFDFLPVVLFFAAYKLYDGEPDGAMKFATKVIIVAMTVQVVGLYLVKRSVEKMYIFTWLAVLVLGGLSISLDNPTLFQWKPTIVNWVFAAVFLGSQFVGKRSIVERMLGEHFEMPRKVWNWTNMAWVWFFLACGVLNLVVAFNFEEETWVNFKLFGLTGMSFAFMFGLVFVLRGYLKDLPPEEAAEDSSPEELAGASRDSDSVESDDENVVP